jgi:hypothetical protein
MRPRCRPSHSLARARYREPTDRSLLRMEKPPAEPDRSTGGIRSGWVLINPSLDLGVWSRFDRLWGLTADIL